MRQGDIYLADLNPVRGSEQSGLRPVVIVSGNAMNAHTGLCIICPLTSKIKGYAGCLKLEPSEINGLTVVSEVLSFQIRVISVERMIQRLGKLTKSQLKDLLSGITDILKY